MGLAIHARTEKAGLSGLFPGLFLSRVIYLDFAGFCKGLYGSVSGVSNRESFVMNIFREAGSGFFASNRGYSPDYAAKLCNGSKPLSKQHRKSFPNPIDRDGLAKYLTEHIKTASARTVMNQFTIPTDAEINISALARALSDQLQIIIHEPDSDANIIASNYQQYIAEPEVEASSPYKPLYEGDAFWDETASADRRHVVDFYENFTHTWKLHNTGKVAWLGRKLICKNEDAITPCVAQRSIDIPDTAPNGRAAVSVEFDARGCEDSFVSEWTIVDQDGKECFPNRSSALNITIVVENKTFIRAGGN